MSLRQIQQLKTRITRPDLLRIVYCRSIENQFMPIAPEIPKAAYKHGGEPPPRNRSQRSPFL